MFVSMKMSMSCKIVIDGVTLKTEKIDIVIFRLC